MMHDFFIITIFLNVALKKRVTTVDAYLKKMMNPSIH